MTSVVFSIRDSKMDGYLGPWICQNDAMAVRAFGDMIRSNESPVGQHPADYDLYSIGMFNHDSGELEPFPPKFVVGGASLVSGATISEIRSAFKVE